MAHDDMHVIIYKVLSYLYSCLKKGERPDRHMLSSAGALFGGVPEAYWTAIWMEMSDRGLVKGVGRMPYDNIMSVIVENPRITLDGVEFLQENSMMRKARDLLRDAKSVLPFL